MKYGAFLIVLCSREVFACFEILQIIFVQALNPPLLLKKNIDVLSGLFFSVELEPRSAVHPRSTPYRLDHRL